MNIVAATGESTRGQGHGRPSYPEFHAVKRRMNIYKLKPLLTFDPTYPT